MLSITSISLADDSYTRYAIPLGRRLQVDGEIYRGFSFPEYKELLRIDVRLREADLLVKDLYKKTELLDDKVLKLNKIIELDNTTTSLLKVDLERKDKLLTELASKNIKLNEQLNRRKRVLRIVLPLVGASIGAFTAGLLVK